MCGHLKIGYWYAISSKDSPLYQSRIYFFWGGLTPLLCGFFDRFLSHALNVDFLQTVSGISDEVCVCLRAIEQRCVCVRACLYPTLSPPTIFNSLVNFILALTDYCSSFA